MTPKQEAALQAKHKRLALELDRDATRFSVAGKSATSRLIHHAASVLIAAAAASELPTKVSVDAGKNND